MEASCRRLQEETVSSTEEQERTKSKKGEVRRQRLQERRHYDEMVVKARLLRHIKDP